MTLAFVMTQLHADSSVPRRGEVAINLPAQALS